MARTGTVDRSDCGQLGLSRAARLLPFSEEPIREMLDASIFALAARYDGAAMVLIGGHAVRFADCHI